VASKQAGVCGRGCRPGRRPAIRHFERCCRRRHCVDPVTHPSRGAASRRIPGTYPWYSAPFGSARHQDNERIPSVLAFRVESGIVYFNVDHVFRVVLDRVEAEVKTLRLVVCDLSTSPAVDLAGARMFLDLHTELAKRGIILRLVEAHASVRDLLRMEGTEDRVGRIDRFATVADALEYF